MPQKMLLFRRELWFSRRLPLNCIILVSRRQVLGAEPTVEAHRAPFAQWG